MIRLLCLFLFCFISSHSAFSASPEITVVYNKGIAPIKFTTQDGAPSGILNEYWRFLADKSGLNFKFIEVPTFEKSLEMVKTGKADLHAGIFYTEDRSRFLSYSEPVFDLNYYIYSTLDIPLIKTLDDTRGFLVGIVQGGYTENYARQQIQESQLVVFKNYADMFDAILNGDLKIFISSNIHLNYYLAVNQLDNPFQHHSHKLFQQTYYGATAQKNQSLIESIKKNQLSLTKIEKQHLKDRWLTYKIHTTVSPKIKTLTAEEIKWVQSHPTINVSNEMDWPPFDFNVDGTPMGLSIDLLNLIANRTGLNLNYRYGHSWSELQNMVKEKKVDLIHSLNRSTYREQFIRFTKPYIANQSVIVTRKDNTDIKHTTDLNHKTVAAINGYNQKHVLEKMLDNVTFMEVSSPLDALRAVSSGQADATIRFNGVASYLIHQHLMSNLHFVNEFNTAAENMNELFLGVRNDWPILQSIMQKGLDSISMEEMNRLKEKWISMDFESNTDTNVIPLTQAEQEWIKANPVITLGSDYRWAPFDFTNQQGEHDGLSADFIKLITERTGLKINIDSDIWSNVMMRMKQGKLDGLACAVKTAPRAQYLNFSSPYLHIPTAILVKKDNIDIHSIDDLFDKTVATNKGSYMHDWLSEQYPEIKLHLTTSNEVSMEAVSYGKADAYIGNLAVANYIIRNKLLTNLKVVTKLDSMITATAVATDIHKPILTKIIQKALDSITEQEKQDILKKWYISTTEQKVPLTENEQSWLLAHPVIRISGAPKWAPVSFRQENGQYAGIISDYLSLVEQKSDLSFTFIPADNWSDALQMMNNNLIDMISAVSIDQRRKKDMDFTDGYLKTDAVLITRNDIKYIKDFDQLKNRKVGSIQNVLVTKYIQKDYPALKLHKMKDAPSGLKALSQGQIDVFVLDIPTFEYYTKALSLANLKISGLTPYSFTIALGISKNHPELKSILNKVFDMMSQKEKNDIYNNWITFEEPLIDYSLIWKTALAAVIFLALMGYWNMRMSREVSLRKKAEYEAVKASKAKSDFLANMSHEIRTPMNSVLGFAELLDNMISEPEQKSYLKSIRSGGTALLDIINDILDLSKIEAGKMIIKPDVMSISHLFNEMDDFFKARISQKNLEFIVDIDPNLPTFVKMDGLRLRQVLTNLIGNAIKFTEDGHISLVCNNIHINEQQNMVDFTITVSDTGIGIPEVHQKSIFNKFEQQDGLDHSKYGGTGLGLAICKSLTRLMGGTIRVESEFEKGAAFILKFKHIPVSKEAVATDILDSISVAQFEPATILIVDDVKDNRQLVTGHFKESRITFCEAENGKEALTVLSSTPVDLILMDLRMPVMNGYETITAIKQKDEWQHLPIIAFTASVMGEDLEKVNQYGFNGYLRKPVSRRELLQSVATYLSISDTAEKQKVDIIEHTDINTAMLEDFLLSIDEHLLPEWNHIKDKGDFELIQQFAVKLNKNAISHQIDHMVIYTEQLQEMISSFDIIEVDSMMKQFPELIHALRQKLNTIEGQDDT